MTSNQTRFRPISVPVAATVLLVSSALVIPVGTMADSTVVMIGALPNPTTGGGVAYDGTYAFYVGGCASITGTGCAETDDIVRYDPVNDLVQLMGAALPNRGSGVAAASDGTYVYLFGGVSAFFFSDQIHKYDPATDTLTTLGTKLPAAQWSSAAVWDGTYVWLFGGSRASGRIGEILRFDPSTDSIATMSVQLPTPRTGISAVWDGTFAYVFGGSAASGRLDEIVRYDPVANQVVRLATTLPSARAVTSAIWDGANAYVFGGQPDCTLPSCISTGGTVGDQIVRFDPVGGTTLVTEAKLPSSRFGTATFWDGSSAFVLGGRSGSSRLDEIVRYDPVPGPPLNLLATPGPGSGQVSLVWDTPDDDGGKPIIDYNVYRSPGGAGSFVLVAQVGVSLSYIDTPPATGAWQYLVTAENANGEGTRSEVATAVAV